MAVSKIIQGSVHGSTKTEAGFPPILRRQRGAAGKIRFDNSCPTRAHVLNGI